MSDYRDVPLTCPACNVVMEARLLSGSTVDACPTCRGLWVDWFDGELLAIVKETAPLSVRGDLSNMPIGGKCPRCTQPLTAETFNETIALLRCSDCAGCFVPRASFTMLLELDLPAYSRVGADVKKLDGLTRLILAIRKVFGAEPTEVI